MNAVGLSLVAILSVTSLACMDAPGRPGPNPEIPRPDEVMDFATLYKQNCAGCHGVDGKNGAALSLANPIFLAAAGEANLRRVITNGVAGHAMPAFDKSAGGSLTSQQIDSLVKGILGTWGHPDGLFPPPYAAVASGDPARGRMTFILFCSRCHGPNGAGSRPTADPHAVAGSLVDPAYLALVSDEYLRNMVIGGRPDLGMPDWRHLERSGAPPMTEEQVSDVVAWLASKRVLYPGQPYTLDKKGATK
ncbi:MAG TPA: cytochrome c [Bryobacteraceae bacterium]|jgi:cytochrome c oxidase cbb3-type subunit 3/ubiquinol-cytochrome c reductase cytochrome c subunit